MCSQSCLEKTVSPSQMAWQLAHNSQNVGVAWAAVAGQTPIREEGGTAGRVGVCGGGRRVGGEGGGE